MRRNALCAVLIALPVAIALGSPAPILGQEPGDPTPGQNEERISALAERIRALEGKGEQGGVDWLAALPVIIAAVALLEVAYRVIKALRSRARPVLSWDTFGKGQKFLLVEVPGGPMCPAVRVTNVGQAAAVDIVAYVGVRVSAHAGSRVRPGARPYPVGPLNPGSSTVVPIPLSDEEHARVLYNETAVFEVEVLYKDTGGRDYESIVAGMYSGRLEFLEGAVTGSLPERRQRGARRTRGWRGWRPVRKYP